MTEPSRGWRRRPSPALVVATLALFVALGGTTYAATTINGSSIVNKSITSAKLKNQSVGTAQLKDFGVQRRDIQNGAVTVSKLATGSVTGTKIVSGAVGSAAIANNSVARGDLQPAARVPAVVVRTSTITGVLPGALGEAVATCNSGETLIAGGAGITSAPAPGIEILANRPEPQTSGSAPTRWQGILNNGSAGTVTFTAHAICALPTP